jgi:hypothetical protein
MAFPSVPSAPLVAPSLAPSGGGLASSHLLAIASELLALGSSGIFPPPPPPIGFAHSVSVDGTGLYPSPLQIPAFVDVPASAEASAEPVEIAPQILALEQVWVALNERLTNEIADTVESRAYANLLLRDVMAAPYTEDSMLHAPHQDLWVPRLDELRVTVHQWANMGELHALIQELETAFINMVAWLHTLPNPDEYYAHYSSRLWTVLA